MHKIWKEIKKIQGDDKQRLVDFLFENMNYTSSIPNSYAAYELMGYLNREKPENVLDLAMDWIEHWREYENDLEEEVQRSCY